jgi:hypothetical protein
MPKVIRSELVEPGGNGSGSEDALAPVAPVLFRPNAPITCRKDERVVCGPTALDPPLAEVRSEWCQQANRARLSCLRLLHVTERGGALDEDRPLSNVSPPQCKRFARPQR